MIKSKKLFCVSMFAVMVVIGLGSVYAQPKHIGRWEKLGERTVNLSMDKDIINCSHKGTFSTIRFHVAKAPVNFLRVIVQYGNGTKDDLNFNQLVAAGSNSPYLDLRGNKRVIKKITIYYKALPKRPGNPHKLKKAQVQIWGKH